MEKSRVQSEQNQLRTPVEAYKTFTELLCITKDFLESFCLFKKEMTLVVKSRIHKLGPQIIKYTIDRFVKLRDSSGQKNLIDTIHKVKEVYDQEKPDIIIGVASGGTEIALIYSLIFDQAEVEIVRYSHQKGCGNVNSFSQVSGKEKRRDKQIFHKRDNSRRQ